MYRTAALGTMIAMAAWALLAPKKPTTQDTAARRNGGGADSDVAYWSAYWNGVARQTGGPNSFATRSSLRAARDAVDDRMREAINRQGRAA